MAKSRAQEKGSSPLLALIVFVNIVEMVEIVCLVCLVWLGEAWFIYQKHLQVRQMEGKGEECGTSISK